MSLKLVNNVECPNCKHKNPHYRLTCEKCNSYLRQRTVNIDFWKTFWQIIYSPGETLRKIIFAEHKNFSFLISIFISVKIVLTILFLLNFFDVSKAEENFNLSAILLYSAIVMIIFITGEFIITKLNAWLGLKNRFKDNFAIGIYSFIPLIFSLFILTPIEYALFGNFWYVHNPSPFLLKPLSAYIIAGIESGLFGWSLVLLIIANYVQTNNKIYSIIISILQAVLIIAVPVYIILQT